MKKFNKVCNKILNEDVDSFIEDAFVALKGKDWEVDEIIQGWAIDGAKNPTLDKLAKKNKTTRSQVELFLAQDYY